jgi:Zn-finger nucleic acid-binding protein/RNA polymerase subunit RPABC4/transcription elongation factor Spt4
VSPLACSRCGGGFEEGAERCPWCQAGIALEDRGRSPVCTRCSRRAPLGARWCPGCGQRIGPQALARVRAGHGCPRCRAELRERQAGERRLTECSSCGGLWLAAEVLEELCIAADREAILNGATLPGPEPAREAAVSYLPCPGCGELMQRRNHGRSSGVIVDVCRHHGVWLDAHELERVLAWARAGGAERERQRSVAAARRAAQAPDRGPAAPLPGFEPRAGERGLVDLLGRLAGLLG